MAVWDQEGSNRTPITAKVIGQVIKTVNWERHRMIIVDNNSCQATKDVLANYADTFSWIKVITLPANIGTARAINKAWSLREEGEHCIKMDNDCFIHQPHWIEDMEAIIETSPDIGMVGLKRKDLAEYPGAEGHYNSELKMLPHVPGEPWRVVEVVNHVMGTCVLFSAKFLKEFGYLSQPHLYGFDDSLASARCKLLGYSNVFIPHVQIDHIDPPNVQEQGYTHWKLREAQDGHSKFSELVKEYESGKRPLYEQAE